MTGGDHLDKKLLELMYARYYRELYIYIYSMCRSGVITEDILQETFLKALLSLDQSHTNMRAWLYTVARNLYYNEVSKNRRVMYVDEYEKSDISNDTQINTSPTNYADIACTGSDTEDPTLESVLRNEEQRILYRAVLRLPPEKRDIVLLQYFAGLRQNEISALMHITPENVRVTAHRAKKDLKKILEKEFPYK